MTDFIKICPQCGQQNPEYENLCSACGHFIAMESAVPKQPAKPKDSAAKPKMPATTSRSQPSEETASFYLHVEQTGQLHTVKSGWVIGQAHSSSTAHIQLAAELDGCRYVHRQHAQFSYQDGHWWVTALDQKAFQRDFSNPSFLNQQPLELEKPHILQDGDRLVLSNVVLFVKMIR